MTITPDKEEMPIEIEELREAGEDGGDLMGFFARGHHDPHSFAQAANSYSGAHTFDDRRHVNLRHVKHVWWRTVQMPGEPKGTYEFRPTSPGERGAWKATVCESVTNYSARQSRMRQHEYDRGLTDGMHKALHWLLWELEFGGVIVGAEALEQRKAISERLRQALARAGQDIVKESA